MGFLGYIYGTTGFLFQSIGICIIKHAFLLAPFTMSSDITFWRYVFLPIFCVISMGCTLSPMFKKGRSTMVRRFQHFENFQGTIEIQTPEDERNVFLLLFCAGICFTMSTILLTSSISLISVTESQVVFGTKTFFVFVLSIWILKSKMNYLELVAILFSFIGLIIFSLPKDEYLTTKENDEVILFDYLGIDLHPVVCTKYNGCNQKEDKGFGNELNGIIRSFAAAAFAGFSVILIKKIQDNEKTHVSEDKIILSNCLHIVMICNVLGTLEFYTENPWTSYTMHLELFFALIFILSLITYTSMKLILKTMKMESPSVVGVYEFQGIIFTAILDSLILGTKFTTKDYVAGAFIIVPNLAVSILNHFWKKAD
ncbi:unnamed protein product [Moneuplotes crassus]|uniref:EamA domain-containing protein n=1 Tax=Euplotes crassus TaxID=5936 RepID=A0AAD1XJ19_EUPCR|nr:unnamed protein product [Moneuplotes crassus]